MVSHYYHYYFACQLMPVGKLRWSENRLKMRRVKWSSWDDDKCLISTHRTILLMLHSLLIHFNFTDCDILTGGSQISESVLLFLVVISSFVITLPYNQIQYEKHTSTSTCDHMWVTCVCSRTKIRMYTGVSVGVF